jgi:uncharacterized RDD family membrane protein YckC
VPETASWLRRLLALFVDWIASTLVVVAFVGWDRYTTPGGTASLYVPAVFVAESTILTAFSGGSFGKLLTRLRVVRADGRGGIDLLHALIRSLLVALVIPPLVFRPDGRGLHDLAAGSVAVELGKISKV